MFHSSQLTVTLTYSQYGALQHLQIQNNKHVKMVNITTVCTGCCPLCRQMECRCGGWSLAAGDSISAWTRGRHLTTLQTTSGLTRYLANTDERLSGVGVRWFLELEAEVRRFVITEKARTMRRPSPGWVQLVFSLLRHYWDTLSPIFISVWLTPW